MVSVCRSMPSWAGSKWTYVPVALPWRGGTLLVHLVHLGGPTHFLKKQITVCLSDLGNTSWTKCGTTLSVWGKMPSPGGPLSVMKALGVDYGVVLGPPIVHEGLVSRFKVQEPSLLLWSSTNLAWRSIWPHRTAIALGSLVLYWLCVFLSH